MRELDTLLQDRIDHFAATSTPNFARVEQALRRRRRVRRAAGASMVTMVLAGASLGLAARGEDSTNRLTNQVIEPVALAADADGAAADLRDLLVRQFSSRVPGGQITATGSDAQTTVRADGPLLALQGTLRWRDDKGGIDLAATWIPRAQKWDPTSCEGLQYVHDCTVATARDGGRTVLYSQDTPGIYRTAVRIFADGSAVQVFLHAGQTANPGLPSKRDWSDRMSLPLSDTELVDLTAHLAVSTTAAPLRDPDLLLHQCMAAQGALVTYTATGWDAGFPSAEKTATVKAECERKTGKR